MRTERIAIARMFAASPAYELAGLCASSRCARSQTFLSAVCAPGVGSFPMTTTNWTWSYGNIIYEEAAPALCCCQVCPNLTPPPGAPGSLKILPPGGRRHFCKQHRDLYVDTGEIRCTVYIASKKCCRTVDGRWSMVVVTLYVCTYPFR